MAEREFKNGTEFVLYIDTVTPITAESPAAPDSPNWRMIACLNTNGIEGSTDEIDTTTKCSGNWKSAIPGDRNWTMSGDGAAVDLSDEEALIEANYNELLKLWADGEQFWVSSFDASREIFRAGVTYLSAYSESADRNTLFSFSSTFMGKGRLYFNEGTT